MKPLSGLLALGRDAINDFADETLLRREANKTGDKLIAMGVGARPCTDAEFTAEVCRMVQIRAAWDKEPTGGQLIDAHS